MGGKIINKKSLTVTLRSNWLQKCAKGWQNGGVKWGVVKNSEKQVCVSECLCVFYRQRGKWYGFVQSSNKKELGF